MAVSQTIWTAAETDRLPALVAMGKSWDQIGREMGRSGDSCRKRFGRQKLAGVTEVRKAGIGDEKHTEACTAIDTGDAKILTYHGEEIRTVDQLLAHAEIDLSVWEVADLSDQMK